MIDIHTHILPGIDDGSRNVEESIAMLREQAKQGMDGVALTPHFYASENSIERFLERRQKAWEQLRPHLDASMPPVCLGAEVQYFEGICRVDGLTSMCLNGSRLLLVEMPFCRWSERVVNDIIELNANCGVMVILAHVERYIAMQSEAVWQKLHANKVRTQANGSFFLDWTTKRKAVRMFVNGQIQFLGSDCHSMSTRAPNCGQVVKLLQDKKANETIKRLEMRENAYLRAPHAAK